MFTDPALWITHRQAVRDTLRAEATAKLWANPLSIYGPDPVRMQVVMYNETLRECRRGIDRQIEALEQQISEVSEARADAGMM